MVFLVYLNENMQTKVLEPDTSVPDQYTFTFNEKNIVLSLVKDATLHYTTNLTLIEQFYMRNTSINLALVNPTYFQPSDRVITLQDSDFISSCCGSNSDGNNNTGPMTFLELTDTPIDYTGHKNKVPIVKNDETGLRFGFLNQNVKLKKVSLTAQEISNLDITPKELIPAPGPDRFIVLHNCTFNYKFNGVPYDFPTSGGSNQLVVSPASVGFDLNRAMARFSSPFGETINTPNDLFFASEKLWGYPKVNEAILFTAGDAPLQGDGTLDLYLTYSIHAL